jgi:hypothetical protein
LRVDRPAERVREHEIPVDVRGSGEIALEELRRAMRAHHVDRLRVQGDRPSRAA